MIEFVYFDLGNVLLSFDPEIACRNVAELLSVSVDEARHAVYDSGLQNRFEHGEVSGDEFARAVCAAVNCEQISTAALLDAVSDMFQPVPTMREVLDQVRAAGYGVGLLSNTCHAHWDWIVRQGYPPTSFLFDVTILSFEIGSMKPDPPIYEAAELAVSSSPQRILFLDDRPENVVGARDRGWCAEECIGAEQAVDCLRRAGVLE